MLREENGCREIGSRSTFLFLRNIKIGADFSAARGERPEGEIFLIFGPFEAEIDGYYWPNGAIGHSMAGRGIF